MKVEGIKNECDHLPSPQPGIRLGRPGVDKVTLGWMVSKLPPAQVPLRGWLIT